MLKFVRARLTRVSLLCLGVLAASLSVQLVGERSASAGVCNYYQIDCTSPFAAQTWMTPPQTKACVNSAYAAVPAGYANNGYSWLYVDLFYSQPVAGASCQTAFGSVTSFHCLSSNNCNNGSGNTNPRVDVVRTAPSSKATDTFSTSDLGVYSKQLLDCCGGFLAKGYGRLLSPNNGVVVSAFTAQF
jgi:hypothetical protein